MMNKKDKQEKVMVGCGKYYTSTSSKGEGSFGWKDKNRNMKTYETSKFGAHHATASHSAQRRDRDGGSNSNYEFYNLLNTNMLNDGGKRNGGKNSKYDTRGRMEYDVNDSLKIGRYKDDVYRNQIVERETGAAPDTHNSDNDGMIGNIRDVNSTSYHRDNNREYDSINGNNRAYGNNRDDNDNNRNNNRDDNGSNTDDNRDNGIDTPSDDKGVKNMTGKTNDTNHNSNMNRDMRKDVPSNGVSLDKAGKRKEIDGHIGKDGNMIYDKEVVFGSKGVGSPIGEHYRPVVNHGHNRGVYNGSKDEGSYKGMKGVDNDNRGVSEGGRRDNGDGKVHPDDDISRNGRMGGVDGSDIEGFPGTGTSSIRREGGTVGDLESGYNTIRIGDDGVEGGNIYDTIDSRGAGNALVNGLTDSKRGSGLGGDKKNEGRYKSSGSIGIAGKDSRSLVESNTNKGIGNNLAVGKGVKSPINGNNLLEKKSYVNGVKGTYEYMKTEDGKYSKNYRMGNDKKAWEEQKLSSILKSDGNSYTMSTPFNPSKFSMKRSDKKSVGRSESSLGILGAKSTFNMKSTGGMKGEESTGNTVNQFTHYNDRSVGKKIGASGLDVTRGIHHNKSISNLLDSRKGSIMSMKAAREASLSKEKETREERENRLHQQRLVRENNE